MTAFLFDRWANLPPHSSLVGVILAVVLFLAVVLGYVVLGALRRRQLERLGHLPQILKLTSSSTALGVARPILVGVALLLLLVVWFRPQTAGKARMVKARGIDLVIVLDYSKSMYARDIPRSRIDRAKQELSRLLDQLSGTRVGLVLFAGTTQELPLTTDYGAVKLFWEDLEPADMPVGGTAIGLALTSATRLLQRVRGRGPERDQVILLITDGEDHESEPIKAAELARKLDIRIYALGIGSPVGELIPHITADGQQIGYLKHDGKFVTTKLDRATLEKITRMTSGAYIQASAASFGVDRFVKEIDKLKKAETDRRIQRTYHDWFQLPLFLALLLLLVEASLGSRRFASRRRPESLPAPAKEDPHA
ncbi:MAG: VWA domain-containing protein [Polyangia bacterium]|jgi:Ca-activated chloride channel family protein|nr:VWA domain-containing protein [Polyangia bacterium]